MDISRRTISPGISLTSINTNKFKTSALSVTLLSPLSRETVSLGAVLPPLLRRGSEILPDMTALARRLGSMYGAVLEPVSRKKGDLQAIGFYADFADPRYLPDSNSMLDELFDLISSMLLHPLTEDGKLLATYVAEEKWKLSDKLSARINDKRSFALRRLLQEMFPDSPYGIDPLGLPEYLSGITAESLTAYLKLLLSTAPIEFFYCGSSSPEEIAEKIASSFGMLRPSFAPHPLRTEPAFPIPREPETISTRMDVAQGQLTLGLRAGITATDPEFPAAAVFNAVFGGTPSSKLFANVREKLSLCYYASSSYDELKGVCLVSSGIAFENFATARDEILRQLDDCRENRISPEELSAAKSYLISRLKSYPDSAGAMEDYCLNAAVSGCTESPEERAERISSVTVQDVAEVARRCVLDKIFFLDRGRQ